jgi:5-methyltetrahydrofolate--homocysteine methyltransferase
MENTLKQISQAILDGDQAVVTMKVKSAIEKEIASQEILDSMINAMADVGRLFEEGEYFVPEMLVSAHAMKNGLEILKPLLAANNIQPFSKVAIGTVKGDLHDIGKNLVAMMLEGAGFQIIDLGVDVKPEKFVEAVKEEKVEVIAMSALLTTTMLNMGETLKLLKESGIRDQVKVIIGGAPITSNFSDQIGADGFATDASQAVKLVQRLLDLHKK